MAFSKQLKIEIEEYCSNHLPPNEWYENEFSFIKENSLKDRIITEFKAIRFAYKLYEGIEATDENLIFEVRNQILGYASIYEVVLEYVLNEYYVNTIEFDKLTHHTIPIKICIPQNKMIKLQKELSHDGKVIVPFYYGRKKKDKPQIRFDEKCLAAVNLGLIHEFSNDKGEKVDLPQEINEIYSYRNGIHILAEQRKGINYELELSKKAYRRMRPFINQIKEGLLRDGKI